MLNQGTLQQRLGKFYHMVSVLLNNPELAGSFADYGVATPQLLAFQALYQRCRDAFFATLDERSDSLGVTDAVQQEVGAVKRIYQRHLKTARFVMSTRSDLARLELRGPRVNQIGSWLYQARSFYVNMGEMQLAQMARFKVTRADVDHMIQRLDALESHLAAVHVSRVNLVRQTRERDAAFAEMALAASELEFLIGLLGEDDPDLAAKLLRETRTSSGNTGTPTNETPETSPESDLEGEEVDPPFLNASETASNASLVEGLVSANVSEAFTPAQLASASQSTQFNAGAAQQVDAVTSIQATPESKVGNTPSNGSPVPAATTQNGPDSGSSKSMKKRAKRKQHRARSRRS